MQSKIPHLCNCGLTSPKGDGTSHIIGGVTIGCGSLDNVVFIRSSKIKGCPKVSSVVFCLGNKVIFALCIISLTPAWTGGRRGCNHPHALFARSQAVICIPFHGHVCVPGGSEQTLIGLFLAK